MVNPIAFVECVWKITPERDNTKFVKGKHMSWQQHDILLAVENAVKGNAKKRISIRSGHGIGKTSVLSWIILWYLFTHKQAQVPCTAPTSYQLHDILWKECMKWLQLMPEELRNMYNWTNGYIRMTGSEETWFARAKTARKESPEALAGVHSQYVLAAIDEASGVHDEIFRVMEGAMTDQGILVLMISNPTRLLGYFYDSHHEDSKNWQTFQFSNIDSPLPNDDYNNRIIEKYGVESDEYRFMVLGEFPKSDSMDSSGYVPLLQESDLRFTNNSTMIGECKLGVDPSGEGSDSTLFVTRDNFKATIRGEEKISSAKSIASRTMTLMDFDTVKENNVFIDNFGVGANVGVEVAYAMHKKVMCVNVGETNTDDKNRFLNKRAECYWRLREWLIKGGELVGSIKDWRELLTIRYKRNIIGKIQIQGKEEMRKDGIQSPNKADALMLTFWDKDEKTVMSEVDTKRVVSNRIRTLNSLNGY